jgi:hypothetical protein
MPALSADELVKNKPAFGSPCNGCGFCCAAQVCKLGLDVYGDVPAPCPGLKRVDGRFVCALVQMADEMGPNHAAALRFILGVGLGCDSETDEEIQSE